MRSSLSRDFKEHFLDARPHHNTTHTLTLPTQSPNTQWSRSVFSLRWCLLVLTLGQTGTHLEAQEAASLRGAIEGAVGSTVVVGAGSYYLHRRYPAYRALPLSLKCLGVIILIAPALSIQAERRGIEFERSQWYAIILSYSGNHYIYEL